MADGLIIAAPSSGAGKTTFTLALIHALTQAGQQVQPYKAGPDYIDPTYLSAAAGGTPCLNLDPWAMRPETLANLIYPVGLAIVEGVMGVHDGPGSTAALARQTGWPLVLVIDAKKSAQTAAALAEGLALRDLDLAFAAFVFNGVASPKHEAMIREGLRSHTPAYFLPYEASLALPSRHLGLHLAEEREDLSQFLEKAAAWVHPALDIVQHAKPSQISGIPSLTQPKTWPEFGLTFAYPHLKIPENTIFLPGGYPELYLDAIKADPTFLPNLRAAAAADVPIYGECGGFMVLGEAIIDTQGKRHEMAGLLPVVTSFENRARHLGYREIEALTDFSLGKEGSKWRGHEFHYTTLVNSGEAEILFNARDVHGTLIGPLGLRLGSVSGSYLHLIDLEA